VAVKLDYFSPEAQAALDLAKQAVPEGGSLTAELLLAAAYHVGHMQDELPQLAPYLAEPTPVRPTVPEEVLVAEPLQPVLGALSRDDMVTIDELMVALVQSEGGRAFLSSRGLPESEQATVVATLTDHGVKIPEEGVAPETAWRKAPERQELIDALSTYGRMLTVGDPPQKGIVEMDRYLRSLQKNLMKMRRPNIIIIGQPGTGKTALVYEFARRIVTGDASVTPGLRDRDIFELSPSFLRSGASVVGQYDERVSSLIKILEAHPKVILFVDEVHSLLQSGMHERGPFTEANESFKQALGRGVISMIGATTTAEYRHYIAPDGALARRFGLLRIEPPSVEDTLKILRARLPQFTAHYPGLRISEDILVRAVDLTEDLLPTRFQPDKSLELLDEACALCVMHTPPAEEVTEAVLTEALEGTIGHCIVRPGTLTVETVLDVLRSKIVGQDAAIEQLATSFVAGLSEDWQQHDGPRGIFFFCGPTGVGKTETGLALSKILGGGREALVRIDCNTLQGEGYADPGPVINRLLGVPPGYIGYARGEGGMLSKVRDYPECIVLFDEIEKAHPGVGKILLQILDEGRVYDTDSNLLDFRRSFIVFTTNAGCTYESGKPLGFAVNAAGESSPTVSVQAVQEDLRRRGYGEEFLGRNIDYIVFEGLDREDIEVVLRRQLEGLGHTAELGGYTLKFDEDVVEHLLTEWQPRFGVRHLTTILRHRILEQLAIAEVQGELADVTRIRLVTMPAGEGEVAGPGKRTIKGKTMTVYIA
jgi:ATP-dependent Clp protease ATP-binding subunit ClpA